VPSAAEINFIDWCSVFLYIFIHVFLSLALYVGSFPDYHHTKKDINLCNKSDEVSLNVMVEQLALILCIPGGPRFKSLPRDQLS
jgi:hypothetical protein